MSDFIDLDGLKVHVGVMWVLFVCFLVSVVLMFYVMYEQGYSSGYSSGMLDCEKNCKEVISNLSY